MTITFYWNNSDANVLTKNLTESGSAEGTLKGECSVTDVVIQIVSAGVNANYMHIPEFNRYYFITEIVSIRNGLWEVHAHVDVLTTYAVSLRALSGIIARQENLYNLYLDDDKFLVNAQRMTVTKAFPNRLDTGDYCVVLTAAGGNPN